MSKQQTDERNNTTPTVLICDDEQTASLKAAELFADAIRSHPKIVLGLATGGTPVPMYKQLIRLHREEGLDFSQVRSFNLDEYIGLPPDHPQNFRVFMQDHLFDHINIAPGNTFVPDGRASDIAAQLVDYEAAIKAAGGIDLQLLGLGHNGHIAFNEPGSPADSRTRVVDLTAETIENNARFFASIDDVPRTAITMGIGTILESKRIVMLAFGQQKAAAVHRALRGEVTAECPASFLQTHRDVTFMLDQAAASLL